MEGSSTTRPLVSLQPCWPRPRSHRHAPTAPAPQRPKPAPPACRLELAQLLLQRRQLNSSRRSLLRSALSRARRLLGLCQLLPQRGRLGGRGLASLLQLLTELQNLGAQ